MNSVVKKTFKYGQHEVSLETGRIARQASGAVLCSMDNTVVLCTVVGAREAREGQNFLPLTVNYQEKTYASGRIPGGFFRREGRPNEKETLTCRLIDRPLRPLFPDGFRNEVQVIATVMSADRDVDPDIPALIGCSAALAISGIPFNGPIGAARVGYHPEQGYLLNPRYSELQDSLLDMVVAGTRDAVLMVESEARELPEDLMLGAVLYGHQEMQAVIQVIDELVRDAGKPRWDQPPAEDHSALLAAIQEQVGEQLAAAYQTTEKQVRQAQLAELRASCIERHVDEAAGVSADQVSALFKKLEKKVVRGRIIAGEPRIDGRDNRTVRPLAIEIGALANDPRVRACGLELPLPRLMALCEVAHSLIAVDSGPAHIAAALGCPSVVLFGAAPPWLWQPRATKGVVVTVVGGEPEGLNRIDAIPAQTVISAWRALPGRSRT